MLISTGSGRDDKAEMVKLPICHKLDLHDTSVPHCWFNLKILHHVESRQTSPIHKQQSKAH